MANNKILIKRTNVPGRVPNTTNSSNSMYIAAGEFALNMADKQLYTSNGSSLITIGSSPTSLTLADSLRIGQLETNLLLINSTAVFTGNVSSNTLVGTSSISVQNTTSNTIINPTTIYVGNNIANISLDVTGGVKTIPISFANISSSGVATIQTTINHGITLVTQAKLFVNTSQISLNTANYSSDYNPAGFNIIAIPTANSVKVNLPTSDFKYRWGDRTITYINRNALGIVTIVTKGAHGYQNGDKAYTTNIKYSADKPPFTFLDNSSLPVPSALTKIDDFTVNYTQSGYSSAGRSLQGAKFTWYTWGQGSTQSREIEPVYHTKYQNKILFVKLANSLVASFNKGDPITFAGLPVQLYKGGYDSQPVSLSYDVNQRVIVSPSYLNKTWFINDIVYNNDNTTTISIIVKEEDYKNAYYFTGGFSEITIGSGPYISVDYTDTGTVTNISQLCPFFANSSIGGEIYATNPTGITIKNGSKLIYVLDSAVYVGNNTIGNIIDVAGSRVFKPTDVTTFIPPTYIVQASASSVNEGSTIIYSITTSNFGTGTLYWTNSGTTNPGDFTDGLNSGTVNIYSDFGTISKTLVNDFGEEGTETIIFELRTNSTSGPIVATAPTVSVIDTSKQTYTITSNYSFRDEGQTVTFTVTTQGVPDGTSLYFTNIGTTNANDFDDGLNTGSFIINSGTGTIVRTLVNDYTSESQENIQLQIRTLSINGPVVITSSAVQVFDTSVPTYSVEPDISPVEEGGKVTFTVTTQGVPDGTTLYWTNSGTTTAADFYDNLNSGNFTVSNNRGTVSRIIYYDLLTEGSQTIIFQVRTGSTSGPIVAYSTAVTVNDTSTAISPYYSVTVPYSNRVEGDTAYFSVYAEVPNPTTLYWTNEGTTNADDFTDGLNSGSFVVTTSKNVTISRTIKQDFVAEGSETIILAIRTGSITGPIVVLSAKSTIASSAGPTVTVSALFTQRAEGSGVLRFTVYSEVPDGYTLYWTNEGTSNGNDFTDGLNSGSFVINSSYGSVERYVAIDGVTEGQETFILAIRTGSITGPIVTTAASILIPSNTT